MIGVKGRGECSDRRGRFPIKGKTEGQRCIDIRKRTDLWENIGQTGQGEEIGKD
jgi:hypothetical protein